MLRRYAVPVLATILILWLGPSPSDQHRAPEGTPAAATAPVETRTGSATAPACLPALEALAPDSCDRLAVRR